MKLRFTAGILPVTLLLMLGCKPDTSNRINKEASISSISKLTENPLEVTPMAVSISPEAKTMSTLYGNGIASKRLSNGADYAKGSVLYLVTWKGKADPEWFGARIPDRVTMIERVSVDQNGQQNYTFFKGPACNVSISPKKDERQAMILSIPLAVTP